MITNAMEIRDIFCLRNESSISNVNGAFSKNLIEIISAIRIKKKHANIVNPPKSKTDEAISNIRQRSPAIGANKIVLENFCSGSNQRSNANPIGRPRTSSNAKPIMLCEKITRG
jgi:hypothetical protein